MAHSPKSSRREFLQGQSAAEALLRATGGPAENGQPHPAAGAPAPYLIQVSRRAMACEFQIYLNAGQHSGATEAAIEALDLVEQLENQLTVYRNDSEVSRLNGAAANGPVIVERGLFELLSTARRIAVETAGAFDITSGPLSETWGFFRRQGEVPGDEEIAQAMQRVGYRHIELNAEQLSVRFLRAGVGINLGGIGKGYALDRCAELMEQAGAVDFLIHGGQSSVLARGAKANGAPWSVALRHPLRPEQRLATLHPSDRALGTSGTARQFFHHRGRRYGHLLDPRSGRPAEGLLSVSVLAPTAAEADALATAFYVAGWKWTADYCAGRSDLAVAAVAPGARSGAIELKSINMAEGEIDLDDGK